MRNYKKYMRYINKGVIVKLIAWGTIHDTELDLDNISASVSVEGELFRVFSRNYKTKGEIHSKTEIYQAFKDFDGAIMPISQRPSFLNRKAAPTDIDHVKEVIARFIKARDNAKVIFKEV